MNINYIQTLIAKEPNLDGWLFCNFAHRDILSDSLLALDTHTVSSRKWFYIILRQAEPCKIVHAIEKNILDSLEGSTHIYSSQEELRSILRRFSGSTLAAQLDEHISVISTLDGGTVRFLQSLDISTVSAATLIQMLKGILSPEALITHLKASQAVYRSKDRTWDFICTHFHEKKPLTEFDVQSFILQCFDEEGLITDHPPIAAFAENAGNPHYEVSKTSSKQAQTGDIILLDMWAKYPDGIYADISWLGVFDTTVPSHIESEFALLMRARDTVYETLKNAVTQNKKCTGFELDKAARSILCSSGYEQAVKHRTGHGIDTECHGSGVNLDSVEFPDYRFVLNGSCFSVEPGLYFSDHGMRTEINIYIEHDMPHISGETQKKVLTV